MVLYQNEKKAKKLFSKYTKRVVFSTDRSTKACVLDDGTEVSYVFPAELYPTTDEQQAFIRGDISVKKIIKTMKKRISSLKPDEVTTNFQVTLASVLSMLVNDKGIIVVFLRPEGEDSETKKLDKLYKRYLEALFSEFGIKVYDEVKKKMLKGKRKVVTRRLAQVATAASAMSKYGRYRMRILHALHYAEIQKAQLDSIQDFDDLSKKQFQAAVGKFYDLLSGKYVERFSKSIETWPSKKERKAILKAVNKQAKKNVKYYNEYRQMVNGMDIDGMKKLPKIYKDRKKTLKAFDKFFTKKKNFGFVIGAYTHVVASTYDSEIGSSEYNKNMAEAHRFIRIEGFAKTYGALASKLKKAAAEMAKGGAATK